MITKHMGYTGKVGFLYFALCCIVWSTLYFMLPGLSYPSLTSQFVLDIDLSFHSLFR